MNDKLKLALTNLILDQPFFGALALRLPLIEDRTIPTFCTNSKWIKYNPKYAAKLSTAEIMGVICHEVLHVSNGHTWRRDARPHKRWNQAADYAINPMIVENGMALPEGALIDARFKDMSAEQIDRILAEEQAEQGQNGNEPRNGNGGGIDGVRTSGDGKNPDETEERAGTFGEVIDDDSQDRDVNEAEWKVATLQAAQAAKAQGKLPAGIDKLVKELQTSKIDWRSALRKFIQTNAKLDYSWKQPNKRFISSGIYLPMLQSENMLPIVIYWDTSGSRDTDDARKECASEASEIISEVKPEKTYVIYGDAKVQRVEEFEPSDVITFNPIGGGGTDFRPIFTWIEKQGLELACFIGITDLYGSFPDVPPSYPVLWACTTDEIAPFGETLRIGD